jgi:hypothetical protein
MIELLSNCTRGREIFTYHIKEKGLELIRKTSITPSGSALLEREIAGWKWYESRRYTPSSAPIFRSQRYKEYLAIDIGWIEGTKGEFYRGLSANHEQVRKAVEHYCHIWPREMENGTPLHGDFSIDNLIFNSSGVHVIDWEHFRLDGTWPGFDAVYLLFETLWFGMRNRTQLKQKEKQIVWETLRTLKDNGRLPEPFQKNPLKNLQQFIRSHEILWGEQLHATPCKLPVLNFSEGQTELIENAIRSGGF